MANQNNPSRPSGKRVPAIRNLPLGGSGADWYWEQDAEHRFTRVDVREGSEVDRGFARAALGRHRWEIDLHIEGGWDAHRALLERREPFLEALTWLERKDGTRRYFAISGAPVYDRSGAFAGYRGVGRDITAQKRSEELLRLEHQVALAFAAATDATQALREALRAICETERWACARYLRVEDGALRFGEAWNVSLPQIERYIEESRTMVYAPGQGVVGLAWEAGEPLWVPDISNDPRVARLALARETGMRGLLAVPVINEGRIVGMLVFQSRAIREPDERLLRALAVIGGQIGQFVERAQAVQAMRESEARFRSLTEMSSDFFWETDAAHRFTSVVHGPNYSQNIGRIVGRAGWDIPFTHPGEAGWAQLKETMDAHRSFRDFEFGRPWSSDGVRHFSVSAEPRFAADGRFLGYRGVGRDITDLVLAREHIASLAFQDALTGLDNRVSLGPALDKAVERSRRRGTRLAGLFIDLDGFKRINDAFGHDAGDRVLVETARRLRASLRASDLVARLGGDEFFVLLEDLQEAAPVERVARKLLAELAQPFELGEGRRVEISASIGVSLFPDDAGDAATLVKHADIAMYAAKQAGKNDCRLFAAVPAANDIAAGEESQSA